jgi:D-hexose-6-phosphate mutarotase
MVQYSEYLLKKQEIVLLAIAHEAVQAAAVRQGAGYVWLWFGRW